MLTKTLCCLLCLLFLFLPNPAVAGTTRVIAYGDVPFGSSYKATWTVLASKFSRVGRVYRRDDSAPKKLGKGIQVYAQKFDKEHWVHVNYWFKGGRLTSCEIESNHSPSSAGEAFLKYLEKRYGKPNLSSETQIYSGMLRTGGTYRFDEYFWNIPHANISLQYRKVPRGIAAVATISK